MTGRSAIRGIVLIGLGAIIGVSMLLWIQNSDDKYDRNVDIAYAGAKARLLSGQPNQNPFAKESKEYPEFELECELGATKIVEYGGGKDKGTFFKKFDLAGFLPAFDKYEIAIYKAVGQSGQIYPVACLMREGFKWKETRILALN